MTHTPSPPLHKCAFSSNDGTAYPKMEENPIYLHTVSHIPGPTKERMEACLTEWYDWITQFFLLGVGVKINLE